jgi:hypothetical protein
MKKIIHLLLDGIKEKSHKMFIIHQLYWGKKYEFLEELDTFLSELIEFLQTHNLSRPSSEITRFKSQLTMVLRGWNPHNSEKIMTSKRDVQWAVAQDVLQNTHKVLEMELDKYENIIHDAEQTIGALLLNAIQLKIISLDVLKKVKSQKKREAIWQAISTNENTLLVQKKLLLVINFYDAIIILDKIIDKIIKKK